MPSRISPDDYQELANRANHWDGEAARTLGDSFRENATSDEDLRSAFDWYWIGARHGDAGCQNNLATMFLHGIACDADEKRAFDLYRQAAEQGLPIAQFNLAMRYRGGTGCSPDPKLARSWFLQSAKGGYVEAQGEIGVIALEEGPDDHRLLDAVEWLLSAATESDGPALAALDSVHECLDGMAAEGCSRASELIAKMLAGGIGVSQNLALAHAFNRWGALRSRGTNKQRLTNAANVTDKCLDDKSREAADIKFTALRSEWLAWKQSHALSIRSAGHSGWDEACKHWEKLNKPNLLFEIGAEGGSIAIIRRDDEIQPGFEVRLDDGTLSMLDEGHYVATKSLADSLSRAFALLDENYPYWLDLCLASVAPSYRFQLRWLVAKRRKPSSKILEIARKLAKAKTRESKSDGHQKKMGGRSRGQYDKWVFAAEQSHHPRVQPKNEPGKCMVFSLAAEGGGLRLFAIENKEGVVSYAIESNDFTPTLIDEDPINRAKSLISGLNAALDVLDADFAYWLHLTPIYIDPALSTAILAAVRSRLSKN